MRVSPLILEAVDEFASELMKEEQLPISRTDAIRRLVIKGIKQWEKELGRKKK